MVLLYPNESKQREEHLPQCLSSCCGRFGNSRGRQRDSMMGRPILSLYPKSLGQREEGRETAERDDEEGRKNFYVILPMRPRVRPISHLPCSDISLTAWRNWQILRTQRGPWWTCNVWSSSRVVWRLFFFVVFPIFVPFRPISCFLWDVNNAQVPSAATMRKFSNKRAELDYVHFLFMLHCCLCCLLCSSLPGFMEVCCS